MSDPEQRSFWNDPPGERFTRRYLRQRRRGTGPARRILGMASGAMLMLLGIVFVPLPGPGFVPLLLGAALIAGESRRMAHWLDRVEVRVRSWVGRK